MRSLFPTSRLVVLLSLLLFNSPTYSETLTLSEAITIDGVLEEDAWSTAREWTKYYESIPFSLAAPKHFQKVLILEDENGMYFGFINEQARDTIRANQHQRDDERANVDKAGVSIDFDGNGLTAYGFSVSAGGSISDSIYQNENEGNTDWDADWDSATHIEGDAWFAEVFIPWSIAPMKAQSGDIRKVKLAFWRMVVTEGRVNTSIKGNPRQEKFLSLFHDYTFQNYSVSKLDFFPFINVTENRILDEVDTKVGMEVFWKIDSGKQLNIALNPDFGQVESDELVVNFTSSETYYSDKRPFFSENHSLFDVKSNEMFYIINTRRIGAAPDYNCASYAPEAQSACEASQVGVTDIDYAVRYTQQNETLDFGFLGASEADPAYSRGNDFYAVRLKKNADRYSFGYLGTYTERPVLDRDAIVHSFDLTYRPTDTLRVATVVMGSSIDQGIDNRHSSGEAFRMGITASPNKGRWHDVSLMFFDDQVDINDMGYQMINNWAYAGSHNGWKFTDYDASSPLLATEINANIAIETNADFSTAGKSIQFAYGGNFKNTAGFKIENFYRTAGKDFWITRDSLAAPAINKPVNYGTQLHLMGPSNKFFNYGLQFNRGKGSEWYSALGYSTTYGAKASFSPRDNLNFTLMYEHGYEDDWLNWIDDNLLGIYQRKQRTTVVSMNWFGGDKHELRVKAQMVAFTARQPSAYLGDLKGALTPVDVALSPFSLSDLAFQVRYRYEVLPLAYLYVVYSKGGRIVELDEEDRLGKLYQRPWDNPQADSFTVKLRYRF